MIDVLGIAADWDFDGHSLYDGTEPTTDPKVDESLDPASEIAARHAADSRRMTTGWGLQQSAGRATWWGPGSTT